MKIKVTQLDNSSLVEYIDDKQLLDLCGGDERMKDDFIRLIKTHPNRQKINQRWELIEE